MANSINWLASRIKQDKDNRLVSDTQITAWNNKANSTHTHTIANITNLQDTLDGKASSSHTHTKSQITDFPSSIKNPTSLSIQLNGGTATTYDGSTAKSINITPAGIGAAASSHTHTIANITNLQDTLDGKASSSHTHGDADITSVNASKITGTISIDHLPQGALDRLVRVDDDAARFKLTTENVQLGDTVKVKSSGLMYYVVDESKLGEEAGYEPYTAGSATSVPWTGVTGKPSTFTPSAHTHTIANITNLQTALDGKAASSHTHTKSQITDFPTSIKNPTSVVIKLNGGTTEGTNMFTYDGSTAKSINITPAGIGAAASAHTHAIGNVTGLQSALDGKAASSHTHTKDQVGLGNVDNTADSAKNVAMATKLQTYKNDSTTETYGTQYPLFAQWDSTGKIINMVCTGYTVRVQSAATADSANAVTWGNVSGKPSTFTPSAHTHTKSQITDFPSSLKNPTSLSIQLNGGTATTYDGSTAKSINITPAGIGAAASSHTHTIANVTGLQTALDGKAASGHNHDTVYSKLNHTHTIANVTNLQATLDSKVNNAPTLVTNWNNATSAGYYYAAKGATNAPEATLGYFGQVCKSTTSIIQTIFPEGASGDIKQYMRRGTISGSAVTWETDWACITYALS